MNYLDFLVAGAVGYGVWRGRRRGVARELPSVVGWGVFFVTGAGLFHWTNRMLTEASHAAQISGGVLTYGMFAGLAYYGVRRFRARVRDWAGTRWPEQQARFGGLAGGVRWLMMATLALMVLGSLPLGFMRGSVREYSLWGRVSHRVIWPTLRGHELDER